MTRSNDAARLVGNDLKQRVERKHGVDLQRGFGQRTQHRGAVLLGGQRLQRGVVKARIIERVGCLPHIKLYQPRLPVRRRMGLPEEGDYHAQRPTPAVDDWRAEHGAKSYVHGCVDKRKVGAGRFDIFNQGPSLHGKEIGGDVAE